MAARAAYFPAASSSFLAHCWVTRHMSRLVVSMRMRRHLKSQSAVLARGRLVRSNLVQLNELDRVTHARIACSGTERARREERRRKKEEERENKGEVRHTTQKQISLCDRLHACFSSASPVSLSLFARTSIADGGGSIDLDHRNGIDVILGRRLNLHASKRASKRR